MERSEPAGVPRAGDAPALVQLSPCVGGLLRTWSDDGAARLWSLPSDSWLRAAQATGGIGRTAGADGRFREQAMLSAGGNTLAVAPRFPVRAADGALTMETQLVQLAEPRRPSRSTHEDFRELLAQAVRHCAGTDEFLIVERGGPDAPGEPFCLFAVLPEGEAAVTVVQTAPAPLGSELWDPWIDPTHRAQTISAPAAPDTLALVPMLMIEAIGRWGLDPWDLAFTFGQREGPGGRS